ncbi:ferritin-like metal-binding protein YciE [Aquabacter spiritensis]|uniref:Ferritin-like metal-binding protein YciE n=2 Tax=Aquabacter spiritensis TaxID=933073 RepID=A0A4V2UX57_9HYPH|nr:ferritin-like metal-binding protein YciE [Aquabacter spiritensis]
MNFKFLRIEMHICTLKWNTRFGRDFTRRLPGVVVNRSQEDKQMAQSVRDVFVVGLKNAHAVENEALSIMNRQIERLESYPELADRLRGHVEETNGQLDRLDKILHELGEESSTFKDTAASMMGSMAALGHTVADDEILKNAFADFAFENYEIAAYRSLISMAEAGGFNAAVPLLSATLTEEEAMARWLADHLPRVTDRYLSLQEQGAAAQR